VIAYEYVITSDAVAPAVDTENVELATDPTATEAVADVIVVVPTVAALAGTTDKSPNPSEATATADTFFNEIVFTIFLSFSQIKDDLLPGW
jgi:Na+/phosphate symporter